MLIPLITCPYTHNLHVPFFVILYPPLQASWRACLAAASPPSGMQVRASDCHGSGSRSVRDAGEGIGCRAARSGGIAPSEFVGPLLTSSSLPPCPPPPLLSPTAGGADFGLAQAVEEGHVLGPRLLFTGHALSQVWGGGRRRFRDGYSIARLLFYAQLWSSTLF